jgi:hypothetical protein
MQIGLATEKVAHYAKKLFDMEVETKSGVRYIRVGNGKLEPEPTIKLRACRRDAILEVFGAGVDRGFSNSPIWQREENEVHEHTDGVSMSMSNRAEEGGIITLYLAAWDATVTKKTLWPILNICFLLFYYLAFFE